MISVEDHFGRLAALLRMEAEAEARQMLERVRRLSPAEAERGGDCLIDLVVRDEGPGLGGVSLLERLMALTCNRVS